MRETSSHPAGRVVGSLTLVYDYHVRLLEKKLTQIQHDRNRLIVPVLHVHLSQDNCMELIALRGTSAEVRRFADRLTSLKGVKQAQLAITAARDTL